MYFNDVVHVVRPNAAEHVPTALRSVDHHHGLSFHERFERGIASSYLDTWRLVRTRRTCVSCVVSINITATGTRKEEKLFTRQTMRKVNILRRVLSRMRPREAVEMLIDRLAMYPSNREFLEAFSLDDVD